MRTFLTSWLLLLCLNITANHFRIVCLGDTLISDSLQYTSDSLMLSKISTMETELDDISEKLDLLSDESPNSGQNIKKKFVHFGLSLGYRWLTANSSQQNQFASVSPIDSTLRLTTLDRTSYLFSTSVVFDLNLGKWRSILNDEDFREKKLNKQFDTNERRSAKNKPSKSFRTHRTSAGKFLIHSMERLCIVSNLNILDFSNGQKELAFNKSIEGGLGIGYKLNDVMYIGFNWEHVQSVQLYDDIKKFEGKKVELNGDHLTSSTQLDSENEDLFYRKNLSGWGIKMIICL